MCSYNLKFKLMCHFTNRPLVRLLRYALVDKNDLDPPNEGWATNFSLIDRNTSTNESWETVGRDNHVYYRLIPVLRYVVSPSRLAFNPDILISCLFRCIVICQSWFAVTLTPWGIFKDLEPVPSGVSQSCLPQNCSPTFLFSSTTMLL
jgi:hypothetical protein